MQADVREDFQTFCLHWYIFNIGVLSFYFQGQKCLAQTQSHSSSTEECSVLANPSRTSMFSANSILECCLSFHKRAQYVFSWTNLGSHESTSSHISAEPGSDCCAPTWKHCPQGRFQYLLKSELQKLKFLENPQTSSLVSPLIILLVSSLRQDNFMLCSLHQSVTTSTSC